MTVFLCFWELILSLGRLHLYVPEVWLNMYEDTKSIIPAGISKVVYPDICERDFKILKKSMACYCHTNRDSTLADAYVQAIRSRGVGLLGEYMHTMLDRIDCVRCDNRVTKSYFLTVRDLATIYDYRYNEPGLSKVFDKRKSYIGIVIHVDSVVDNDIMTIKINDVMCNYVFDGQPRYGPRPDRFASMDGDCIYDGTQLYLTERVHSDGQLCRALNEYHYSGGYPSTHYDRTLLTSGQFVYHVCAVSYIDRVDINIHKDIVGTADDII